MSVSETTEPKQKPAAGAPAPQLLFYRRPEMLNANRHASLQLKRQGDFRFAKDTNSVPITGMEFALVMRSYPIVFVGKSPLPAAVLGLERDNVFVQDDGRWMTDRYIPAYMRRYPFVFIGHPDGKSFVLGVDRDCPRFVEGDDEAQGTEPLFQEGKPTKLTEEALRFCGTFQTDHSLTAAFGKALEEQKLLIDNQAQAQLPGGRQFSLGGFRVVDRTRFQNLPDAVIAEWHRLGWLALVTFHLASLERWSGLLDLQAKADPKLL